jgi:rubrerythrin
LVLNDKLCYNEEKEEHLMSFFEKLGKTVQSTVTSAANKSQELLEVGKLKLQRSQILGKVQEKQTMIGQLIYTAHQQQNNPDQGQLTGILAEIDELMNQVKMIDQQLATEMQETPPETPTSDTKFCSNCGKPIATDAVFCPHCGASQA